MPAKLKIGINTTEHFQVLPLRSEEFKMQSDWWSGNAKIATYEIDELMATKLRALYQRRKGRDLFDLWLVMNLMKCLQRLGIFKLARRSSKAPFFISSINCILPAISFWQNLIIKFIL